MKARIITLFGEELIPEQLNVAPKAAPAVKTGPVNGDPLEGWEPDKQYYSIGEVAALFDIRTSHIRFWVKEFELKLRTTRNGDRLFTAANIRELRAIYHLVKELGFTIPGAKARMKDRDRDPVAAVGLRQSLLQLRNQLLIIRNKLV